MNRLLRFAAAICLLLLLPFFMVAMALTNHTEKTSEDVDL